MISCILVKRRLVLGMKVILTNLIFDMLPTIEEYYFPNHDRKATKEPYELETNHIIAPAAAILPSIQRH